MAINIKPQLVRQQPAYLGNMGPRGMGLSSRSRAIFVAACKPYDDRPCIGSNPCPLINGTHLYPLDYTRYILRLQQELLTLHPHSDDILPLEIVIPQPTLCMLHSVAPNQVVFLRIWDFVMFRRRVAPG